jgi:hypothetical protein
MWLKEGSVRLVAMEATGVYWKPVYYALEHEFEVWLCNAHHVKNVPGRKTDMSDAEWLADVAAHGMVRPSFVPPPPIQPDWAPCSRFGSVTSWTGPPAFQHLPNPSRSCRINSLGLDSGVTSTTSTG